MHHCRTCSAGCPGRAIPGTLLPRVVPGLGLARVQLVHQASKLVQVVVGVVEIESQAPGEILAQQPVQEKLADLPFAQQNGLGGHEHLARLGRQLPQNTFQGVHTSRLPHPEIQKIQRIDYDGVLQLPLAVAQAVQEGLGIGQHLGDLILSEIHHSKCYVLGEVERPGVYEMPGRESLLAVLARSGGIKNTAGLGDVLIFRNDGLERPVSIKVDLSQATDKALAATNIYIHPADIIYVPKGAIDDVNDMINKIFTKGIYSILPFSSSFTANYDFTNQYNIR